MACRCQPGGQPSQARDYGYPVTGAVRWTRKFSSPHAQLLVPPLRTFQNAYTRSRKSCITHTHPCRRGTTQVAFSPLTGCRQRAA